jgi:hypothetical protein
MRIFDDLEAGWESGGSVRPWIQRVVAFGRWMVFTADSDEVARVVGFGDVYER